MFKAKAQAEIKMVQATQTPKDIKRYSEKPVVNKMEIRNHG